MTWWRHPATLNNTLQEQLSNANKRIAELVANNKNKQEALLDVVKILNEGLNKHGKEMWS